MENLYLSHHGVKGQKWGVRHYQNSDGSYKPGAEGRYNPDGGSGRSRIGKTSSTTKERKGLSDKQKTALKVAAGVGAGAAVAVGGKKALKVANKKALMDYARKTDTFVARNLGPSVESDIKNVANSQTTRQMITNIHNSNKMNRIVNSERKKSQKAFNLETEQRWLRDDTYDYLHYPERTAGYTKSAKRQMEKELDKLSKMDSKIRDANYKAGRAAAKKMEAQEEYKRLMNSQIGEIMKNIID